MTYHDAQIEFLEALHEASHRNLLQWRIVEDDDRDAFVATFDDQQLEVELLYTAAESGRGAEQHLLRLTGLKTYITCSIGTRAYDIVVSMLSHHILGWAEGRAGGIKSLARATQKIRALLDQ